ncbi:MAG TPA: glycoside hydrolase family 2 TIM barrel-domain containing protein [Chloroflexota bacterium]
MAAGDDGLGRPWQWLAAVLLAAAIAGAWWWLNLPSVGEEFPARPAADRRVPLETAVSVPGRATRQAALAPPARATRLAVLTQPARATRLAAPAPPARQPGGAGGLEAASGGTPTPPPAPLPAIALAPGRAPEALPLRGMGYNPTYATADVAPVRRDELIGRDMRLMASVGVNMVLGWEPGVFDDQLLAAAQANEVSVIMPFDLKPDWNYGDPEVRLEVLRDVAAWVARYRDQPAVVMWGVGNEVTLAMSDQERRAFAEFYVDLFELVRALDSTRPVVLREAEDVFAPYLAEAFARRQGVLLEPSATPSPSAAPSEDTAPAASDPYAPPAGTAKALLGLPGPTGPGTGPEALTETPRPRPVIVAPEGFVYGVNFYTERIGPALADWVENTGLDVPLLVSEYAPAGMSRAQRPVGFEHMHGLIGAAGPRVLGSAPYTWTTAGPEAVDAYFGLVDAEGRAVDATAAEIARMYGVPPPTWTLGAGATPELAGGTDLPRLLDEAVLAASRQAELESGEIVAAVASREAEADVELGVAAEAGTEGDQRVLEVARLIGWASQLAQMRATDGQRLFPGMGEALPLLKGMARWAREEQSAVDTARDFAAAVLRRDLALLGAAG